jgi:hypothetical protein
MAKLGKKILSHDQYKQTRRSFLCVLPLVLNDVHAIHPHYNLLLFTCDLLVMKFDCACRLVVVAQFIPNFYSIQTL